MADWRARGMTLKLMQMRFMHCSARLYNFYSLTSYMPVVLNIKDVNFFSSQIKGSLVNRCIFTYEKENQLPNVGLSRKLNCLTHLASILPN